jgi:hypothetical protein
MTTVEFGFKALSDVYPQLVVIEHLIHQVSSNIYWRARIGTKPVHMPLYVLTCS